MPSILLEFSDTYQPLVLRVAILWVTYWTLAVFFYAIARPFSDLRNLTLLACVPLFLL